MSRRSLSVLVTLALLAAGCGGKTTLFGAGKPAPKTPIQLPAPTTSTAASTPTTPSTASTPATPGAVAAPTTPAGLGFPLVATKNTTRVAGNNAVENAAAVALAVFPSGVAGTHPGAVTLAPYDDWQAALAASSLMAAPFRAPVLLSGPGSLPRATQAALSALAPTGDRAEGGTQVFAVGDVPSTGLKTGAIPGTDPFTAAAAIDAYEAKARGRASVNVIIVSADSPAFAIPAAGYAAESGEPILFVHSGSIPAATQTALATHHQPHIYILGPTSAVSDTVASQLAHYGTVKRIQGGDPAANSVAFAAYRDPACPSGQPCAHIPHSFGWAIRSPGHAYVLINAADPLDAAAASALSSSGGYGPQLVMLDPNTLPSSVLAYFQNYATPGYTSEGPTAAVYNHAWLIGDTSAISNAVQSQVDSLLEVVPQK